MSSSSCTDPELLYSRCPAVPSPTTAPLARSTPRRVLRLLASGRPEPAGYAVTYDVEAVPAALVRLTASAVASAGISMPRPGALDPLTKEMIYLAVSVSNGCNYCLASHTAAARKAGMSEAMFGELMAVVGMANETNRLANGYRVPVDKAFED